MSEANKHERAGLKQIKIWPFPLWLYWTPQTSSACPLASVSLDPAARLLKTNKNQLSLQLIPAVSCYLAWWLRQLCGCLTATCWAINSIPHGKVKQENEKKCLQKHLLKCKIKNTLCTVACWLSPICKTHTNSYYVWAESLHFSKMFVFTPSSQTPQIITVYNPLSVAISDSTQSLCKYSQALKIILTISVRIMHSYDVCFIQCLYNIIRCVQEYTALYNNQSESTEMAQIMLCTERKPHLSLRRTDFVNVTATQTGFSQ